MESATLRPTDVLASVAHSFGVTVDAITGPARTKYVSSVRREACRRLVDLGLSLSEVGAMLNRDHTTVLYAIRRGA